LLDQLSVLGISLLFLLSVTRIPSMAKPVLGYANNRYAPYNKKKRMMLCKEQHIGGEPPLMVSLTVHIHISCLFTDTFSGKKSINGKAIVGYAIRPSDGAY